LDGVVGLRVGLIAPPWVPVPPTVYGGTELVLDVLARGLQAAGCDVTLFTTGDSTCQVPRSWLYPEALGTEVAPRGERAHVERAYRELAEVDVIHDHTLDGPVAAELHPRDVPVVTTMHGVMNTDARARYTRASTSGVAVVAISNSQRATAPELPVAAVIHHGVDVDLCPFGDGDGGYVLFLGRMSADKGVHRAIAVARAAGRRLVIAAKMWETEERRYFTECVEPLLGPDVDCIGPVGGREKLDLLAGAAALVNPIRWPEPFGLVMIEALACGTPVLSFAEGAATEIVDHGRTGFLCIDEADMAARLAVIDTIDRAACRSSAETRFSAHRMVERHLALYRRLLSSSLDAVS
jgi:glycosyltransferase involved in cell wall biosynthesis